MVKIAPSILAADINNIEQEIGLINQSNCEYIHCDIMDGHFVSNTSFGSSLVKNVRKLTNKILDVHLMVKSVESDVELFSHAGADLISFHIEAEINPIDRIKQIKKKASNKRGFFKKYLATTYSPTGYSSTIGADGLNFFVRNGKRCNPIAIVTIKS